MNDRSPGSLRSLLIGVLITPLALSACSSETEPIPLEDAPADAGSSSVDVGMLPATDASEAAPDAAAPDAVGLDVTAPGLTREIEPGSHVQVKEGRLAIGEAFASVRA